MLQEITLKNFKLFEEVTIKPGLITVLIGPNGSGKSSIFQALGLMKQSRGRNPLKFDGPLVFGEFSDFLHRSDEFGLPEKEITFKLNVPITQPIGSFFPSKGKFLYEASFREKGMVNHKASVFTEDGGLFIEGASGYLTSKNIAMGTPSPEWFPVEPIPNIEVSVQFQTNHYFAKPFRIRDRRGAEETEYETSAERFCNIVFDALDQIYIVPALRGFEQLTHKLLPDRIVQTDLLEWTSYQQRAEAVATILLQNNQIREKVKHWVENVTNRGIDHKSSSDYHVAIESSKGEDRFNAVHEGFGTNQLFYLFTQVALAPAESLLCIDEPEIHLHPKAQNSLTSVLVDIAADTKKPKRLILSTHSEHILMALLTLVAEDRLKPQDLAVYYFQRTEDEIDTTVEFLEVNDNGQIKGGLGGFFGTDEEANRYVKALFKKAKA